MAAVKDVRTVTTTKKQPDKAVYSAVQFLDSVRVADSGRAISFKPDDDSTFLVGTSHWLTDITIT